MENTQSEQQGEKIIGKMRTVKRTSWIISSVYQHLIIEVLEEEERASKGLQ